MGYGKSVYQAAVNELEQRRQKAELSAAENLQAFYGKCRRAEEITAEKASFSAKIAKAVLSGGNAKESLEKLKKQNLALQEEFRALLSQYGFSDEDIAPRYTCAACSDTGFIDGKMCTCLKHLQRAIAYEKLSMNAPLKKCTFDTFSLSYYKDQNRTHMQRTFDFCKRYADRFTGHSPSLLFRGRTGLGKTHLSLAIANVVIEKGYGVIYGSAQNFAVALEKERFDRTDTITDTNSQLLACDFLIIDDLGTEFSSSYVTAALYNIVNTRLLADKPTIISTNLTLKELETKYSERLASRIIGQYGTFEFVGSDVRYQKRRERYTE